jgi:hypothetical protein
VVEEDEDATMGGDEEAWSLRRVAVVEEDEDATMGGDANVIVLETGLDRLGISGTKRTLQSKLGLYVWTDLGRAMYVDWWEDRLKTLRKKLHLRARRLDKVVQLELVGLGRRLADVPLEVAEMVLVSYSRRTTSLVQRGTEAMVKAAANRKDKGGA